MEVAVCGGKLDIIDYLVTEKNLDVVGMSEKVLTFIVLQLQGWICKVVAPIHGSLYNYIPQQMSRYCLKIEQKP